MFIKGDIFKVNDKEYRLRFINKHNFCWLEPVLIRNSSHCVTGGQNKIYAYENLSELEYLKISE